MMFPQHFQHFLDSTVTELDVFNVNLWSQSIALQ